MRANCGKESGTRANVLWGNPSRRLAGLLAGILALAVSSAGQAAGTSGVSGNDKSLVAHGLLEEAKEKPNSKLRVIVQSRSGVTEAERAFEGLGVGAGSLERRLGLIGAVALELKADKLEALAAVPGLTITRDAPVHLTDYSSTQLWPYQNGDSRLWGTTLNPAPTAPAIAIVDSGIESGRLDFAGRVVAEVRLGSATGNSPGDGRGHGTFVAGIAAGAAPGYAGAAPGAKIVSIDVMDDAGMALTSDVIAAADWIVANKSQYDIRVANFSLHTTAASNFTWDPLDKAVEKLWFSGVVVVAASGNYGTGAEPSRVKYAPGNDPFVITVGALDLNGTAGVGDDFPAPWSAYGYTYDGFSKPELVAAGRYMVGPVPALSTLATERPAQITAPGYMQLSGTSFAAPVVAGTAAQMLARHPDWTPDQVKGALMLTARPVPNAAPQSTGVGQINAVRAAYVLSPPNPNLGLNRFVISDPAGGPIPVFDDVSWNSTAQSDVSWNSVSWNSVSWNSTSWSVVSWNSVSWNSVSWNSVSWNSVSWNSVTDEAIESAVLNEARAEGPYPLTAAEQAAIDADPELAVP